MEQRLNHPYKGHVGSTGHGGGGDSTTGVEDTLFYNLLPQLQAVVIMAAVREVIRAVGSGSDGSSGTSSGGSGQDEGSRGSGGSPPASSTYRPNPTRESGDGDHSRGGNGSNGGDCSGESGGTPPSPPPADTTNSAVAPEAAERPRIGFVAGIFGALWLVTFTLRTGVHNDMSRASTILSLS